MKFGIKIFLIASFLLLLGYLFVGCGKRGEIYMGPFSSHLDEPKPGFDLALSREVIVYGACIHEKDISYKDTINRLEKQLDKLSLDRLPTGMSLDFAISILQESGVACHTQSDNNTSTSKCSLTKGAIYGLKDLYFFSGWKTYKAWLVKTSLMYTISSLDRHILAVSAKVTGIECHDIDTQLFDESETIKPIRRRQ